MVRYETANDDRIETTKSIIGKAVSLQKNSLKLRKLHEKRLGQTKNADQTPGLFDMPESTTVNFARE